MLNPEFRQPEFPPSPRITFLHDSFLFINDTPLELPDLTPEIFDLKLKMSLDAIVAIVKRHHYNNIEALSTLEPIRTVRLGRLTIPDREDYALSDSGMTIFNARSSEDKLVFHKRVDDLKSEYKQFWNVMQMNKLPPVIESNITGLSRAIDGTWLSVKVTKQ